MNTEDYSQFYSAGYFIIRKNYPKWETLDPKLLPSRLISLSACICPRFELVWGWTPTDNEAAVNFGIPESKWDEFHDWCCKGYEDWMDMWSMFHSLEAAQCFIQRFIPNTDDLWIIGAGLPCEREIDWYEPEPDPEEAIGYYGIAKRISQRLPMQAGGERLGFEVLSFEYGDMRHSWLCSYLHRDMNLLFGIKPNQYGLIDTYYDAKKVCDWVHEDKMQGHRDESSRYDFWLLNAYPLEAKR